MYYLATLLCIRPIISAGPVLWDTILAHLPNTPWWCWVLRGHWEYCCHICWWAGNFWPLWCSLRLAAVFPCIFFFIFLPQAFLSYATLKSFQKLIFLPW